MENAKNIVLLGMAGTGKTTLGRWVAEKLNKPFVDVDEWIIAQTGKDPAEHLHELGDDKFLKMEGELTCRIKMKNGIISTTGSTPLDEIGMNHLRQNSYIVMVHAPMELINARIRQRPDGASRIVGSETMTIEEIFRFRMRVYMRHQQYLFRVRDGERPVEQNALQLIEFLGKHGLV